MTAGHLKGITYKKIEKFSQNLDNFYIPNAITQKVLKLQISDGVHWKAKNVSFPNNIA